MSHSFSRRSTAASDRSYTGRRTDSFQRKAEQESQKPKKQGKFAVYNLQWVKLKKYLEEKYHPHTFQEQRTVQNDKYVWIIPDGHEDLTSEDEELILKLLDKSVVESKSSRSPTAATITNEPNGEDDSIPRPVSPE